MKIDPLADAVAHAEQLDFAGEHIRPPHRGTLADLLERIAPHTPAEDLQPGEVDDRTFFERAFDHEVTRSEAEVWTWFDGYDTPYWNAAGSWTWLRWGLGAHIDFDHGDRHTTGYPSSLSLVVDLGPFTVSLSRAWTPGGAR